MNVRGQDSELVEKIRVFAMDAHYRDGVPPVGNTAIRVHPTPKDDVTNPHGFGAASFRFGDKLYTMVTVPNESKNPKALPGVTPHLTLHNGNQVHYNGEVGGVADFLDQRVAGYTFAAGRKPIIKLTETFEDLTLGKLKHDRDLAGRLADVQIAMGLEPEEKLMGLRPKEVAATPA